MFDDLPRRHFRAIYADPPWRFETFSDKGKGRAPERHYRTMPFEEIRALPVIDYAADDCVLFLWATWPMLPRALELITSWGFTYKTAGFDWMKANVDTIDLFPDPKQADMTLGYWTRSNSEPCLLATRGNPKRINADVRMGIIEKAREHSRKPDCVYERIERLVDGPYLEMFARTRRNGWCSCGNQLDRFLDVHSRATVPELTQTEVAE